MEMWCIRADDAVMLVVVSRRKHGVRASVRARARALGVPVPSIEPRRPNDDETVHGPGFHGDHLHAPDGQVYRQRTDRLTAQQAQELLRAGAPMVIDDCGCGGFCGLEWPDDKERAVLALRPPSLTKKRFGRLEEWISAGGDSLLLQIGDVRWP